MSRATRIPSIRAQVERWDAREPTPVPDGYTAGVVVSAGECRAAVRMEDAHADFLAACEQVVREVECHCADYPRSPVGSCPHCVCRAAVAEDGGAR